MPMPGPPPPPGPDYMGVEDVERQLAHHGRGISVGQVVFDVLFGVLGTIGVVWVDPTLFTSEFGLQAAFPAYVAPLAQVVAIFLAATLVLWLATGARRSWLGVLVAGPFALGFALSLFLGVKLIWAALGFGLHLKGVLGLAPWFAAFVFARQGLRALRAAAAVSPGLAAGTLVIGTIVLATVLGVAAKTAQRRARLLEDQLFSKNTQDHKAALMQILGTRSVDVDSIALRYADLRKTDPRRERLAKAYLDITGDTVELGLQRLGIKLEEGETTVKEPEAPPRPPAPPSPPEPYPSTRASASPK